MKVFISWSGARSHSVGVVLRDWLKPVIQSLDIWMSDEHTPAGVRWSPLLSSQLANTHFGVVCLTPENLTSPWIMFEAGALAKSLERARVVPVLLELKPSDLAEGPLAQFQGVDLTQKGIQSLVKSLHQASGDANLPEPVVLRSFEVMWPLLEKGLRDIGPAVEAGGREAKLSERELLEEILELMRRLDSGHRQGNAPLSSEEEIVSTLERKLDQLTLREYELERIEASFDGRNEAVPDSLDWALRNARGEHERYKRALAALKGSRP